MFIINPFIYGAPISFSNLKSISLDGVDETVSLGTVSTLDNLTNASYSLWFKIDNTTTEHFLGGYYTNETSPAFYGYFLSSSNKLVFRCLGVGGTLDGVVTGGTVSANVWNHVAFVYDASLTPATNALRIYLNGSLASTIATFTGIATDLGTTSAFNIGGLPSGSVYYDGNIDEVSLFDYSLSASEVTAIWNLGCPNELMSLVEAKRPEHYYRFENVTFPTVTDLGQTGGNNGTMTNMESGDIVTDTPC